MSDEIADLAARVCRPRPLPGPEWPAADPAPVEDGGHPVDGDAVDMRQVLPAAESQSLASEIVELLRSAELLGMSEFNRAALVVTWIAPQLADARLQVKQAGAALVEMTRGMHRYGVLAHNRHEVAVRLRQELAAALAEAERFGALTEQRCPIGAHTGWFAPSNGVQHRCPWCQLLELGGYVGHIGHVEVEQPECLADDVPVDERDDAPATVLCDLLLLVGVTATEEQVDGWTLEQRREAERWAVAVHLSASDNPVDVPARPVFLAGGV